MNLIEKAEYILYSWSINWFSFNNYKISVNKNGFLITPYPNDIHKILIIYNKDKNNKLELNYPESQSVFDSLFKQVVLKRENILKYCEYMEFDSLQTVLTILSE